MIVPGNSLFIRLTGPGNGDVESTIILTPTWQKNATKLRLEKRLL